MILRKHTISTEEFPIILSFTIGIFLLVLKVYSFLLTQSTAVFADLLESIVHLFVVGFALFSVLFAKKPADGGHHYGHDRIAFFSAGFEGAMIFGAALSILYTLLTKRSTPTHLEEGIALFFVTFMINALLGLYLQRRGKHFNNLILQANGKHLLADCVSTGGVVLALVAVKLTKLTLFDPLFALLVAVHILWTGSKLLKSSIAGLMDKADPTIQKRIAALLNSWSEKHEIDYHRLRHRLTGNRIQVDVHLLFPEEFTLHEAHEMATQIESELESEFVQPVDFVSHLEPKDDHDSFHEQLLGRKENF